MVIGTVKFFNAARGYGFITPEDGSKDVFVHMSAVERAGWRSLADGQKLSFQILNEERGRKAVDLAAAD